jgi:hypothetical protein
MRMLCAWCLREGGVVPVEERPPLGDEQTTYGICVSHRLEVLICRYLRTLQPGGHP